MARRFPCNQLAPIFEPNKFRFENIFKFNAYLNEKTHYFDCPMICMYMTGEMFDVLLTGYMYSRGLIVFPVIGVQVCSKRIGAPHYLLVPELEIIFEVNINYILSAQHTVNTGEHCQ
ncbi:unnamed protein product [Allacma fusca]|uniref:Uncharacterized protein n=1 Tax=Allacma fusca TaxID=39272 RepID=A0A8J2NV57_9HEXA|nr:unnamed protein product [Allacma fusca]